MNPKRLKQIPYLHTGAPEDAGELELLLSYIASIDDALTRQIFTLRYTENCSWEQVARKVGGGNTAEAVRKRHNRYIKRH